MLALNKLRQLFAKTPKNTAKEAETLTQKAEQGALLTYHKLSGKGLSLAVKAQTLGQVPQISDDVPTFYVLREYSRSNSLLVDLKTRELGLPSPCPPKHQRY